MAFVVNDVDISPTERSLLYEKHIEYIANHGNDKNDFEYCMTEFLRMSGVYWGVTALDLLGHLSKLNKDEIIDFVKKCQCSVTGGFSPCDGHDPHILYTLSAIQILCIYDALDEVDLEAVAKYVASLQQPDGSFFGDKWGEIDTRFSFCAVAILALIVSEFLIMYPTLRFSGNTGSDGQLQENDRYLMISNKPQLPIISVGGVIRQFCLAVNQSFLLYQNQQQAINVDRAVDFVMSCCNADGGFGSKPNAESHAGLIYCCVAFLSVTHQLHRLDSEKLCWWLCERQLPSGGLNGRPEKLPDVCYSWWVLASLTIMGRLHWISADKLEQFILSSQDSDTGGFSDRTGNLPDIFHTLFGLAALSLLGYDKLGKINPTLCMPQFVMDRLNIKLQIL